MNRPRSRRNEPPPAETLKERRIELQTEARGVYQAEGSWPDTRRFQVLGAGGRILMDVTVLSELATDDYLHALCQWLERVDPAAKRPRLQLL